MTYPQKYTQNCPICGRRLRIQVRYVGKMLTCQHCHGNFIAHDPSSIWDEEPVTPLEDALCKLQTNLEKSGVLDKSGVLIHGVEIR